MTDVIPYTTPPPVTGGFAADWLLDPAEIAQRIGGTDFVPQGIRNNPAAITAALLYGAEVGLGRMQSLAKIAVINGRPTLAAEAQRALILAAGHELWVDESTINRCTIAGRRKDSEQVSRVTWTMDDARRANLAGKQPWRMYPRQMLLARASAELARAVFPDAIGGLAATEELEDEPEAAGVDNGATEPAKRPATRRRRRTAATIGEATESPATETGDQSPAEEPAGDPGANGEAGQAETPAPPAEPEPASSLPADEQAVIDEAKAAGAEEVPMITDPQRRKLHALFRDKGIEDRGDRLAYCGRVLGRTVETSTDLTLDEAGTVLEHLEQYDPSNPQTEPFPEGF